MFFIVISLSYFLVFFIVKYFFWVGILMIFCIIEYRKIINVCYLINVIYIILNKLSILIEN